MSKAAELAALIANVNKGSSLGSKNFIINGAQNVAQRGTSSTGIGASSGYFTVDRFGCFQAGTAGRVTMTQESDGPAGFANCMKFACTTADTSVAAGEQFGFYTGLEGQDVQRLEKGTSDAKPVTVSFWVKGNASATYVLELYDWDNTRNIAQTFAVTTSWNRIELTFAGDTSGAFNDDNGGSLGLYFHLHAGSNYTSGTLNTSWGSITAANRVVGGSSIFDSTDRTFFMTGLQMEIGEKATEFEHEPYDVTYKKCLRYYQRITGTAASNHYLGTLQAYASASVFGLLAPYLAPLRIAKPTVGQSGTFEYSQTGSSDTGNATIDNLAASDFGWMTGGWGGGTVTAGYASGSRATENAYLEADAEL
tara:strand:- start:1466 stop:2560 length:1095 start_codon:yes stop_codon:yes gene_type:complete